MKSFFFFIAILCLGLMATLPATAQDYEQRRQDILKQQATTRSEIEKIDALINQYQQRFDEAQQKYEEIYKQYENLQRLLALQQQKITSLQKERSQINAEIAVTQRKLKQQEEKLKELIENYKETMRYVYKHGRTSQLALILSSASVNQMTVRNYYLKKFESFREQQAADIKQTQIELKESEEQLDQAAEKNKSVLAEIQVEKDKQQEKTQQQAANVSVLKQDRQKIKNKLQEEQQRKAALNSTLSDLITREEEVRKAEQERLQNLEEERQQNLAEAQNIEDESTREREVAKYDAPIIKTGFIDDAELKKIETDFSSQKGRLPWPVESTTISEHFGRRRNPIYGTLTNSLGIEIVTKSRDPVKVVHSGYVFAVRPIAGYGDVVFVSHGKYKTAYGNLSRVLVRKNSILKKGDVIGYAGDENSTRGESVFFMLRDGSENIDPENWLK